MTKKAPLDDLSIHYEPHIEELAGHMAFRKGAGSNRASPATMTCYMGKSIVQRGNISRANGKDGNAFFNFVS